jgi:hypothetical protein
MSHEALCLNWEHPVMKHYVLTGNTLSWHVVFKLKTPCHGTLGLNWEHPVMTHFVQTGKQVSPPGFHRLSECTEHVCTEEFQQVQIACTPFESGVLQMAWWF